MRKTSVLLGWLLSLVFVGPLWANPQGGVVMNGSVQVPGLPPNTLPTVNMRALEIHNAPNTVINWQSFGIDVNEVTSFVQQSAQSAVLNRVVGQELSSLLGRLESNGRVYLLNPNGVIVGQGAVIDTAGFIASALSMTDEDFLAGQLRFAGDGTEGPVINRGYIRTSETGDVLLVAPSVTNEGVIETQGGNVVLAAGKSVVITSLEDVDVEYEVSAPSDSVVNLGEVITGGGAAAIFAGTIQNRGRLDATALVVDESGEIRLVASDAVELTADSALSANGADGGQVSVTSGGGLAVEGVIEAKGEAGTGGEIDLTGAELVLTAATVEASGTTGGGRVRVGGEFQGGRDLAVDELTNAETVTIDSSSRVAAEGLGPDAPGGEVIVWSDGETVVSGEVSAMPGAEGLGGFVELSGKGELIFRGSVAAGAGGTVLFDPQYVVVDDLGQSAVGEATSDGVLGQVTLDPATVETLLDQGTDVLLQADNDIYVRSDILVTGTPTTPASLTLEAGRSIEIEALITTNNGNLIARANAPFGRISDGSLDLGTGPGNIFVRDKAQDAVVGTYGVNAGSGFVQLISLPFNAAISNSEQGGIYLTHNDFEADTVRVSADTIEMIGMGVEFSGPFSSGGALLVEGADITVRSESGLSLAPVSNASSNLSISAPALCVGAVEVSCGFEASIEPAVIEPILLQGGNVQLLSNFDTYVQESIDAASGTGSLLLDAGGTLEINASIQLGGDLTGIAQSPTLGIGGLDSTPHLSLTADDFNGDVVVSANSIYLELVNDPSWGVTEWEELYLRTAGISQGFALSLTAATDLTLKAGYIFVHDFSAAAGSVSVEAQNINLSALRTWTDPVSTSQYSDGYIEIWSGIQGQSGTPTIDLTATQNLSLDAAGAIWISADRGSVGLAGNNIGVQVTDGTYARYDLSLGLLDGGAYPLELDTYSYIEIVSGGGAVDFSAADALQLTASGHVLISDLGLGNVSVSGGNT
ncbi:MAG: filamentous hemagglutinin N-terminal domain-containing protein, partial [Gammaproteobacteria bacterium]